MHTDAASNLTDETRHKRYDAFGKEEDTMRTKTKRIPNIEEVFANEDLSINEQ